MSRLLPAWLKGFLSGVMGWRWDDPAPACADCGGAVRVLRFDRPMYAPGDRQLLEYCAGCNRLIPGEDKAQ